MRVVMNKANPDHVVTIDAVTNDDTVVVTCSCGQDLSVRKDASTDEAFIGTAERTIRSVAHHIGLPPSTETIDEAFERVMSLVRERVHGSK